MPMEAEKFADAETEPQEPYGVGRLSKDVGALHGVIDQLQDRLGPVLGDENPEKALDMVTGASKLSSVTMDVRKASARLWGIIDRLEV